MIIGATTTWNSINLIQQFLGHYRRLGFHQMMVMDFDSTDGTQGVLNSGEWSDFVRLVPFPGIHNLDSSNILLGLAKTLYPPDTLCLFCDPDEFLVTPTMTLEEERMFGHINERGGLIMRRFNMTAPLEVARSQQTRLTPFDALTFRIDKPAKRDPLIDIDKAVLHPPWIFSRILGKVLVRLKATLSIGPGDHSAKFKDGNLDLSEDGIYLLHYPFRTWGEFEKKIEMANIDFCTNSHRPINFGWESRRWIRLSLSNGLYKEYLAQFVPCDVLNLYLTDGRMCVDESVRKFNDPPQ